MNLEKEIQLFEEWCDIFGLPTDEVDGEYTDPRTTIAFLAWYEVVNREGYKLVPIESLEEALSWGNCASSESWNDEQREEIDKHYRVIEKAMIGAVE